MMCLPDGVVGQSRAGATQRCTRSACRSRCAAGAAARSRRAPLARCCRKRFAAPTGVPSSSPLAWTYRGVECRPRTAPARWRARACCCCWEAVVAEAAVHHDGPRGRDSRQGRTVDVGDGVLVVPTVTAQQHHVDGAFVRVCGANGDVGAVPLFIVFGRVFDDDRELSATGYGLARRVGHQREGAVVHVEAQNGEVSIAHVFDGEVRFDVDRDRLREQVVGVKHPHEDLHDAAQAEGGGRCRANRS